MTDNDAAVGEVAAEPPPGVPWLRRVLRRPRSSSLRNALLLVLVTAVAGSIAAVPEESTQFVRREEATDVEPGDIGGVTATTVPGAIDPETSAALAAKSDSSTASGNGVRTSATGNDPAAATKAAGCSRRENGGETDRGVTASSIGLASTIVTSGPGSSFLGLSQYGMQAVVAKVNASGGICGRSLSLRLSNDNWDASRGHQALRNYINDDSVFALPVVPSSEGLRAAGQDIEEAGIPVVGSDGMLIDQYENPWIWPVAAATVTQVRVMAKYAYDRGAKTFAIVFDQHYRFGREGREAFEEYVKTLPGARFVHGEGIIPDQAGYGTQIDSISRACQSGCDALVVLADPSTAEVWISGDENFGSRSKFRMGASPLFNDRFGQNCKARCDGMLVFTGYVPALEGNTSLPGIRTYVQDVRAVQPSADTANQFLEGSYLGMTVFVEALKKVGPTLTRARLRDVMNSLDYSSDLSSPLSWRPDKRFANLNVQAWQIQAPSSFDGFRDLRTGWLPDPKPS